MKSILIAAGFMAMTLVSAHALKIQTTAGSLSKYSSDIYNTCDQNLELSGTANACDLKLLTQLSPNVRILNLADLEIVACNAAGVAGLQKDEYAAGELPEFVLAGALLKKIEFPRNLQTIGIGAFTGSSLESVNLPASLKKIEDSAFAGCSHLNDFKVNSDVSLGKGVFKDCISLKTGSFDAKIREIPELTFDGCIAYTSTFPSSVEKIGPYAYRGTAVESVNLRNVTKVGDFAFASMPKLRELYVPSSAQIEFGKGSFFDDKGIDVLPAINGEMPPLILANTSGKSHYVIRSSKIGESAYANNRNIDTLTLGSEVREISRHAFRNLSNLVLVDAGPLKTNIPDVDEEAFSGLKDSSGRYDIKLNVERGTNESWKEHPVWGLFEIGQFDTGINDLLADAEDIHISRNGDTLIVSSDALLSYIGVFTLDGLMIIQLNPMQERQEINGLPEEGVLVVKAAAGNFSKIVKIK